MARVLAGGANFRQVGWPASGELDVPEGGGAPTVAHSAVHLAARHNPHQHSQHGWGGQGGTTDLGTPLDRNAHRFGVFADDRVARFSIDRRPTMTAWARDATDAYPTIDGTVTDWLHRLARDHA